MREPIDVKLLRKILRKGKIGGSINDNRYKYKYVVYGVSKKFNRYYFNIRITDHMVMSLDKNYTNYGWYPYNESSISDSHSRVMRHNWIIRNDVMRSWSCFLCGTFGISIWCLNIGLIKRA